MRITFTNANGDDFYFWGNYILSPRWSGFGEMPVDVQSTKAPYQDGRTYVDSILDPKEITIEFTITGDTRQDIFDRRKIVAERFNPKYGLGTLKWEQEDSSEYYIDCIPRSPEFPDGEGQSKSHQIVIVSFIAPDPVWYDPTQEQHIMVGFSGGLSFPLSFPISFGTVGTTIEIENEGSMDTPVQIYLYGEITNPVIKNNTTDEEITIEHTIPDGDIMIVNTAFGEKSVQILSDGSYTNAFKYVDPDSEFWKLEPGINSLSYTTTSEGENAECRVLYYHRWGGL